MNRYKDQANKILENIANKNTDENGERIYYSWEVEKAMCQLAEEVRYENDERWINSIQGGLYLKKQVEELLQKQREYCFEKSKLSIRLDNKDFDEEDENSEEFIYDTEESVFYIEKGCSYDNNAEFSVDENSILNAKLKIN